MLIAKEVKLVKPLVGAYDTGILGITKGSVITVLYEQTSSNIKKSLEDVDSKDEDYLDMVNSIKETLREENILEGLENG